MNTAIIISAIWTAIKIGAVVYLFVSCLVALAERAAKKEERNNQITDAIRAIKVAEVRIKSLEEKNDKLTKEFESLERAYLRGKVGK